MDRFARTAAVAAAICAVAVLSGCVYYNTFYHAKTAAREAEILREARPPDTQPSVREVELLDRVIEKSGRVLRLHPDSSWADDALLLLGMSLYYKGQYESAEERLTEFLTRYPDSPLRRRAEYALAGVRLQTGNPVSSEELLHDVAYADPPSDLSDDALILMGAALRARGRREAAAEAYLGLLERFPGSDRRAEARFLAAENYMEMGRPEEAVEQYSAVAHESGGRELLFEARLRLAEAHLELEDPGSALAVLEDLKGRAIGDEELDKVLLLVGQAQTRAGELDAAISTYEGIAASRERTPAAAEAHYRIGLIHRDEQRDLDAALDSFEAARAQAPRSEAAELATSARDDIEQLQKYLTIIEEQLPKAVPPVAARQDTSAASEVEGAESAGADTAGVSEAAEADGAEPAGSDTTGAEAGTEVEHERPVSNETAPAEAAVGDTSSVDEGAEVAAALFRAGELYLFQLDDPGTALRYYDQVVDLHPTSPQAPKAALARAWLLGEKLEDAEASEAAYEQVIERYPGTDYASAAREALGLPEPAPSDTLTTEPAPPDTLSTEPAPPNTLSTEPAPPEEVP